MLQNKVVIISKNTSSFIPLQESLKEYGMDTWIVSSISDIFEKYITLPFVLAIIDANSYGEDTLKLVSQLHGAKPAPILVLMSETYPGNLLKLLQMGATVCMNAETSLQEQTAQAKALIQVYSARDDNIHRETIAFGTSLVINPVYRIVVLNGEITDLPRREFDLLYFMARHNMQVFTPEQLYRQLWSDGDDTHIGDTVKSAIKVLRKKLEPTGYEYIQNVWGTGYRFVGDPDGL